MHVSPSCKANLRLSSALPEQSGEAKSDVSNIEYKVAGSNGFALSCRLIGRTDGLTVFQLGTGATSQSQKRCESRPGRLISALRALRALLA